MNRSSFIAATSAALAALAIPVAAKVPVAAEAAPAVPIEYGALKMWRFDDDFPWVIAESAEQAIEMVGNDVDGEPRVIPPGESVTMLYDELPAGLQPDCECDCEPEDVEEYGCECDAMTPSVTLPAAVWAMLCGDDGSFGVDPVIWEYEG